MFNNTYSTASDSDYSQTAFLSSRYTLVNSKRNFFKEYPRVFMWDILKPEGYKTAYISSQDDEWANMIDYYNKKNLDVYEYSLSDREYDYGSGNAKKDYDENTIKKVKEWLNETLKENGPFYLYINLQATHYPYEYPKGEGLFFPDDVSIFTSYFNIADDDYQKSLNRYDNSIYYVDKQVGDLIKYFDDSGLFNNSVIVLTSDHGEILERRHRYLRHGFGVYDEEVKVPLIIYIPGEEHRVINHKVKHIDVVPTLLNLFNFSLSEEFQGKPMVENENIFLIDQNQNFNIGLIKGDTKYVLDGRNYIPGVYNLTEDPFELNNLAADYDKIENSPYAGYRYILYQWYNCQLDYYKKEKWRIGEVINCG